jgi:hypothetical protein
MRSRIAVDSIVSKIDHTPLLMGSDASRFTSNSCPSDGGVRAGTGEGAGAGVGAAAGVGDATGAGEGVTSWAAPAAATASMNEDSRTADLNRPWAHGGARES